MNERSIELAPQSRPQATSLDEAAAVVPKAPHRLEYIDGLRALAALWVAFHHAFETSPPTMLSSLPVLGAVLASLSFGQFPVMVFLMLSGFCLYYPIVKKNPDQPRFSDFASYIKRRARRIGPPYLWAGAFCMIFAAFPALQVGRWEGVADLDASVILSHLFMVHNLIPSHAAKIDYPMWSVGLEWQLYLFFPLMVWAFRRTTGPNAIAVLLVLSAVIHLVYRRLPSSVASVLRDGPLAYLEIFAAGMLVAALAVRRREVAPKWLLGAVVVLGFGTVRLGSGNGLVHDLATTAAAFAVLLLAADSDTRMSRLLSSPSLVRIGFFSYSIYLMHAPLLHLAWFALRPLRLPADLFFAVLSIVCMPMIVAVCYAFHVLFERPFMRVKPARDA
jgi:peptidoglycan/LPS O-acetylase OafA/YrhL